MILLNDVQNSLSWLGTADIWVPIVFLMVIFFILVISGYRGGWKRTAYFSVGNLVIWGVSALIWLGVKDTLVASVVKMTGMDGSDALFAQILGLIWFLCYVIIGNLLLEGLWAWKLKRIWGKLSIEEYDDLKINKLEMKAAKKAKKILGTENGDKAFHTRTNKLMTNFYVLGDQTKEKSKYLFSKDAYKNLAKTSKAKMGDLNTWKLNFVSQDKNGRVKILLKSHGAIFGALLAVTLTLPLFFQLTSVSLGLMTSESKIENNTFAKSIYDTNTKNFSNVSYYEDLVTYIPALGSAINFNDYFSDKSTIVYDESDFLDWDNFWHMYRENGGMSFYDAFRFVLGGITSNAQIDGTNLSAITLPATPLTNGEKDPYRIDAWIDMHRAMSSLYGDYKEMFENVFNSPSGASVIGSMLLQGYIDEGYIQQGWNNEDDWYYDGPPGEPTNPSPSDAANIILNMIYFEGFPGVADNNGNIITGTQTPKVDNRDWDNVDAPTTDANFTLDQKVTRKVINAISLSDYAWTDTAAHVKDGDKNAQYEWNPDAKYGTLDGMNLYQPTWRPKGDKKQEDLIYAKVPVQGSIRHGLPTDQIKFETIHPGIDPEDRLNIHSQDIMDVFNSLFVFQLLRTKQTTTYNSLDQVAANNDPNAQVIQGGLHDAASKSVKMVDKQVYDYKTDKFNTVKEPELSVDFVKGSDTLIKGWNYMGLWNNYKAQLNDDKANNRAPSPMPKDLLNAIVRNNLVTAMYASYSEILFAYNISDDVDMSHFATYAFNQGITNYDYTNVVKDISSMFNDIFAGDLWDF